MTIGTDARLERIGTDGKYMIVPMDHGITLGAVQGLKDIESTIDAITRGDAVLTQKGIAPRVHGNKNGSGFIVHLNASTVIGPDSNDKRRTGTVEEAGRVGAGADRFLDGTGSALVVRVRPDHRRGVEVYDEPAAVLVAVDPRSDPLLGEDGVGAAARDRVDRRFDVFQSLYRSERDPVVHRDDHVFPVCPDALESRVRSDSHGM